MKDEKPDKNIEDVEKALKEVDKIVRQLHQILISLGLDYANKISGHLSNDIIIRLRNNLLHRNNSIVYHLELLLNEHGNATYKLNNTNFHEIEFPLEHQIMQSSTRRQFFLFESLIFHTISLFDYVGNMIDYICGGKKETKLNWNGVYKASKDENHELSQLKISYLIQEIHYDWLNKLYSHRSDLIHNKIDLGGNTLTHHLFKGEYELNVYAPFRFTKRISELRKLNKKYHLTLRFVAFWMVKKGYKDAIKIIEEIRDYMERNRVVSEEDQPIIFDKPDQAT